MKNSLDVHPRQWGVRNSILILQIHDFLNLFKNIQLMLKYSLFSYLMWVQVLEGLRCKDNVFKKLELFPQLQNATEQWALLSDKTRVRFYNGKKRTVNCILSTGHDWLALFILKGCSFLFSFGKNKWSLRALDSEISVS